MPFDPFLNIATLAGLQTLDTEATDDSVTDSAAIDAARPAWGAAPRPPRTRPTWSNQIPIGKPARAGWGWAKIWA